MIRATGISRRCLLRSGAAAAAVTIASPYLARAAEYPSQNIDVIIPTREGGGADRNFRAFTSIWKKYLNTNFEPGFYPGASGRVGYEVFMGKAEPNAYNLIFGNMGPEVLNWVVKAPGFSLDDYFYFGRVDTDPGCVFVGAESPFQSIDDIVAAGKKGKLNVGTSRMAHPASIGILALGEKTGARFNLIPLSGGKNTIAGAVTGEVDFSVLTSGTVIAKGDTVRTLLVFGDNLVGDRLDNAPSINDHFGMDLPPMLSARAFAIHRKAVDDYPDRYEKLVTTFAQTFKDPELLAAYEKARGTPEYLNFGDADDCAVYVKAILEIGAQYKSLLSGG
ncbi:MAG: tripartite tricarboxylate transporter substrate-binding protein [Limibaculum sp.]